MKKAISLLVAIATACSVSVMTFAANDVVFMDETGTVRYSNANDTGIGTFSYPIGLSGAVAVDAYQLYLVEGGKVVGGDYNKLDPDTEYKFRIYYNPTNGTLETDTANNNPAGGRELTGADVNKGNIRLRTLKGSSYIQSATIKTIGRGATARYDMVVKTRASYGTKLNDVEYSLNVTGNDVGATFAESVHTFEVGYETIDDSETDIGEGGTITISNDYPVITKDQFVDIAKSANYKTVIFEGEDGGWRYTGRVSGMPDSNFFYSYDVIPELANKFPEMDYKFLTFKAGVTFPTNGEMRIDVSDIYDNFAAMNVYLYRNGKLTPVTSTYDSGANEIVFRTNYLGAFVITDAEVTDTDILNNNNEVAEPEEETPPVTNNNQNNNNPNTGADRTMNVAMTLGLVSLVTAGAISRKKK